MRNPKMKPQRIFIAIKIANTDQIRNVFRELRLDLCNENIKWVNDSGLHITLQYIGSVKNSKIKLIDSAMRICASSISNFHLQLKSLGAFPSVQCPKVFWLGVESENNLYTLRNLIVHHLNEFLSLDYSQFSPHVTIGRIRYGCKNQEFFQKQIEAYENWCEKPIIIDSFVMMESVSTKEGTIYKVLKNYFLLK